MPAPANEAFQDLPFPVNGLDVSTAFMIQRQGTTPVGQNVRAFEPLTGRARGGSRPGLVRYLPQLPNGAHLIQHLNIVVDPAAAALLDSIDDGAGFLFDPSSPGQPSDWAPGTFSRIPTPKRRIRRGGTGRGFNKNRKPKSKESEVVWADPDKVAPGVALSGTQLNAAARDPDTLAPLTGNFIYTPPAGTVLSAGLNQPLDVLFEPDDSNYLSSTKTVHVNVVTLAFVQASLATYSAFVSPANVSYSSDVTQGNLLVFVAAQDRNATVAVTDSRGNTWTSGGVATSGGLRLRLFWAVALDSGPMTVHYANSAGKPYALAVLEYSGVLASAALDDAEPGNSSYHTSLTTLTTKPVVVNHLGDLVLAAFAQNNNDLPITFAPMAGMNVRVSHDLAFGAGDMALYVVDRLAQNTTLTVTGTFTDGGAPYVDFGISFRDP